MNKILHYLRVYKEFFTTSYSQETSFRTSFILLIVMDLFFHLSTILTVNLIFDHVQQIGPLKKVELMFFMTFMLTIDQLHMVFVSSNFWEFSLKLRTGELDYYLLKPLHFLFNIFFRSVRIPSIINGPIVWALMIYFGMQCQFSFLSWFLLPFFLLLGLILIILIELILSASMIWMIEGTGINFLRMQLQQVARWPDFIFSPFSRRIFTFLIPVLLTGSAPVRYLINPNDWSLVPALILYIVLLWYLMIKVWNFALKSYTSASS